MLYQQLFMKDILDIQSPKYAVSVMSNVCIYEGQGQILTQMAITTAYVPLVEENVDWDEVAIRMLEKCTANIIRTTQPTYETWAAMFMHFVKNGLKVKNVVMHPETQKTITIPIQSAQQYVSQTEIHTTELCSKNEIYFLPEPKYFGVTPTKNNRQGMAILMPEYVVKIRLVKDTTRTTQSVLDVLVML